MKSFKLKSALVVLFLSISFVSCSNDDNDGGDTTIDVVEKATLVTEIKGPATGKVNDELSYEVTYVVDNSCGEFSKISEVSIGAVKGLQVVAKYPKEGVCTQQVPEPKKTVYKYKATAKGTIEIKFKKSETEFLIQKVVID